jgi:hypothetical protein
MPKPALQLRIFSQQPFCRVAFKQPNEIRNRASRMQTDKDMHMISTDLQSMHLAASSRSSLTKSHLATAFNSNIHKYPVPILGHKHNVERTLAIAMAKRLQIHFVYHLLDGRRKLPSRKPKIPSYQKSLRTIHLQPNGCSILVKLLINRYVHN